MKKNSTILILGGSGLLGGAVKELLLKGKYQNVLTPRSKELNLLNAEGVKKYLKKNQVEFVFMLAGLVGGIIKNSLQQADAIYQNTMMILNLLESLKEVNPQTKLLYTGSTCIYPRDNPQPIKEERLLAGKLEETNIGYAIAKITGIVACQKYQEQYGLKTVCCMPTNLYGVGDNYHPLESHFLAALIRKFLLAKEKNLPSITFWGSGKPKREALYSSDCAAALIHLMRHYQGKEIINIGVNKDLTIKQYVALMKKKLNYQGEIIWDQTKPDGTLAKKTDIRKLKKIFPDYHPRTFLEGVDTILKNPQEVKKILTY